MSGAVKRFNGVLPLRKLIVETCKTNPISSGRQPSSNSHVQVSFHLQSADWLPEETKSKLLEYHQSRLTKDGFFKIQSNKTRKRTLNVADCLDILRSYISEAEQPPQPELIIETVEIKREQLDKEAARRLRVKVPQGRVSI